MKLKKEDMLFIICCILTAVIFAIYRSVAGDFVAYNGDFQNYNVFRRLLDGQVQYKDFTNYLGNAMIFVNLPLIWLFNSFGESVFITNFTTSILYSFILFVLFYLVLKKREKAYIISSIIAITAFVCLHVEITGNFYYTFVYDVLYFEELGHSMRTTRAFLPFLLVGIVYFAKNTANKENVLLYILESNKLLSGVSFIMGALTVWSNDFGYAGVICFFAIVVIVNLFWGEKTFVKRMSLYGTVIGMALIGALTAITVMARGNVMEYIILNMGITDYQFWYYGNYYDKYLTVFDIFSDKEYTALTIIFFVHALFFLSKTISHRINDDDICKLFLHGTCFGASLIYAVGSGAHNYTALELVTYIWVAGWIGTFLKEKKIRLKPLSRKKREAVRWLSFIHAIRKNTKKFICIIYRNELTVYIFIMLILYFMSVNIIRRDTVYSNREKVEGLNVYSVIGRDLNKVAAEVVDGTIFSTYAGALETVNDVFQPTGTDYIIHVLGDSQREKYINNFRQGDYRYVSSLKNEYTNWEYWATRANWFFYKELYSNYEPVNETNYSVLWEQSEAKNLIETDFLLNWEYLNESTCRIDIELPDYADGAYVDLHIQYNTVWTKNRLKCGGMRKVVCVQDGGEQYNAYLRNSCYYLCGQTENSSIPVYVRDGKGYVYISAYPLSCVKLEKVDVAVNAIIKEPEYSLHVTNYTDFRRWIATDGVDQSGQLLKFDNTEFNTTKLFNAGQIKANGETGIIDSVWRDGDYIYVMLENPIERNNFIYPNVIETVKKEEVYTVENYTDENWICGICRNDGIILLNKDIDIEGLYAVKAGMVTKRVKQIELTKSGYYVTLHDNNGIQIFAYPQEIELLYR